MIGGFYDFVGIVITHISLTVKVDRIKRYPAFPGLLDLPAHIFFQCLIVTPVREIIFQSKEPANDRQGDQSEEDAECVPTFP